MEMFFVNPGSFDYLSCADLAQKTNVTRAREQELKMLIDRAEQGVFGTFVATTAYRPEYLKAQGDLKLLGETAQSKNCAVGSAAPAIDPGGMSNPQPSSPPR